MSKYQHLWQYIAQIFQTTGKDSVMISFDEIQEVLGFEIDHSFLCAKKECNVWGYQVRKISLKERKIAFSKIGGSLPKISKE